MLLLTATNRSYSLNSASPLISNKRAFINHFFEVLSYDVASESEITPCNKIDKPLVVYKFTGKDMTSITTLRT